MEPQQNDNLSFKTIPKDNISENLTTPESYYVQQNDYTHETCYFTTQFGKYLLLLGPPNNPNLFAVHWDHCANLTTSHCRFILDTLGYTTFIHFEIKLNEINYVSDTQSFKETTTGSYPIVGQ